MSSKKKQVEKWIYETTFRHKMCNPAVLKTHIAIVAAQPVLIKLVIKMIIDIPARKTAHTLGLMPIIFLAVVLFFSLSLLSHADWVRDE